MEPTIIIIGGGTFGVSTAYHLAQRYKDRSKITIIDRSSSPPKLAAAIDINRVIRTDYPNKLYCDLAYESIHPWFWSLELGPHFHKVGWLMLNEQGSDISDRINQTFKERGSNCAEQIPLDKLEDQFDGVLNADTRGFDGVYFNPEAGWVDAAAATDSFLTAAIKRGVNRITAEVVELVLDSGNSKVSGVKTADGQALLADKILLATGAWTSWLLSSVEDALNIPEQDRVEQQARATGTISAYYKVSDEEIDRLSEANTPVVVYGGFGEVIPPSRQNRLMKYSNSQTTFTNTITTKSGHRISVPRENQYDVPESLKRETKAIMSSRILPDFAKDKEPEYWRICYDAQTPTEDPLICKYPHPKLSNLYLAVGGSFHSYKFMPIIGRYIANVLDGESNGEEKDKAWAWKTKADWNDVREFGLLSGRAVAKSELKDLESGHSKL